MKFQPNIYSQIPTFDFYIKLINKEYKLSFKKNNNNMPFLYNKIIQLNYLKKFSGLI